MCVCVCVCVCELYMYTVTIMIIHAELSVLNVRELCLSHSNNVALACTITYFSLSLSLSINTQPPLLHHTPYKSSIMQLGIHRVLPIGPELQTCLSTKLTSMHVVETNQALLQFPVFTI